MSWEDRYAERADKPPPRIRPNIFAKVTRLAARHPLLVIFIWIVLAVPAAVFAFSTMRADLSEKALAVIDPVLAEAQRKLDAEFPEPRESIVVVIDSKDPRLARNAAERMANNMTEQRNSFRNVFAPGTGRFFDDNGILYLELADVERIVGRIERSAPLFRALSASPNLTSLSVLTDQVARAIADGRSPEGLTALFSDATKTVQAQIAGKRRDLDWLALIEHRVNLDSTRWYILAYPAATAGADPTRQAVNEAHRLAGSLSEEFGQRITVALTGRPVLRAATANADGRALLLPAVLSTVLLLVILGFGLSRLGKVVAVIAAIALGFAVAAALVAFMIGRFDRLGVTFPALYVGFAGLSLVYFTLRAEEAERGGLPRTASLMLAAQTLALALCLWLAGVAATGLAALAGDFTALVQLALATALVAAVIFLVILTLLPAFLSLLPAPPADEDDEDEQLHWLDDVMARPISAGWWSFRRGLAASLAALAVLCGMLVPALHFASPAAIMSAGDGPAERLFYELAAREPSLLAAGQVLAEPGDEARTLVRRLASLPEVGGVRWVEAFLPSGEADKRAVLSRLQGVFPRFPVLAPDIPDDALRTEFVKLQDNLRRISAEPAAAPDLALAANELRRSLALLDTSGTPPPAALRQLERAFFVKLQLLLDRIDHLSRLEPLTVERLDPAIHRQYVSREGLWRIEAQPRRPDDVEGFAAALRRVAPTAVGAALIEADRLAVMRAAMPGLLAAWALCAVIVPAMLFRNLRKTMRVTLPIIVASLLGLGIAAIAGLRLYPESVSVFVLTLGCALGAAVLAESWYRVSAHAQWSVPSSRPRAILLSAFLVLAAFAPLILSASPAVQQFGNLTLMGTALSLVGLFVLLPQMRAWTAPRRTEDEEIEDSADRSGRSDR